MAAAPIRFLGAALWPVTVWSSLGRLEEHPADDYVERTSPIIATAVAFWICALALIFVAYVSGGLNVLADGVDGDTVTMAPRWASAASGVLWFFLPVIYIIGLWLFTSRDEAFPR
jgi:hypothetical protein